MRLLLFAVGVFAAGLLVHVVWWRMRVPERQTRALLLIFGASGTLALPLARLLSAAASGWDLLQLAVFHAAASLAYICLYSGIEVDSPTLCMALHIWRSGGALPKEDVIAFLMDAPILENRLAALFRDGLLEEDAGILRLTGKGSRFAVPFVVAARVLGFPKGG